MIGRLSGLMARSSLGFRLGCTLVLALFPLGVLSIVQAQHAQRELDASTLEGIAGAAMQAVAPQINLIENAQTTARVFADTLTHSLDEGAACVGRVKSVARGVPEASLVAYIPLSGLMTCSSNDAVSDFSANPLFQRMVRRPLPSLVVNPMGPISGTAIVAVGHPVFDRSGAQVGIVTISLPYLAVAPKNYADPLALWRPSYIASFTRDGTVLIASEPEGDRQSAIMTETRAADLADQAGNARFDRDDAGPVILSVTEVAKDLFLFSVWRRDAAGLFSPTSAVAPYLLPALTWLAALVVASFASSRLVVRHVRTLSRSMTEFMTRRSRVRVPDLSDAPAEIQRLHDVYEDMIRRIEHEEAELQNLIVDKDVLVREINHRSGNSLQIIASIMRMYRRETPDPEQQAVLDSLINRVIVLSSTHTSLYALSGQRDVPADEVLANVLRRLKDIHHLPADATEQRFEPVRMDAEAAVPLALAVAEAVSCLFATAGVARDHTSPGQASPGQVVIALTRAAEGRVQLTIDGPTVDEFAPETVKGIEALPRRMLQQFATQLSGTVSISAKGQRTTVLLDFPLPGLKG